MSALELIEKEPAPQALAVQPQNAVTPADLLRIAFERNDQDMDRLERLMAMQERYLESQERERQRASELSFRADFAAFRGENVIIPKSKRVDRGRAGSFFQAEFDSVCRMLSPALSKHGFGFRHDMKFGPKPWPTPDNPDAVAPWVWVTCYLEHRAGFVEKLELEGPADDQSANTPVQNMQSTASYLKRQSLLAITGTSTGGEDDESRLKGQRTTEEGNEPDENEALLAAGEEAALGGEVALNGWWGKLTGKQRSALARDFGGLKQRARQAEKGGAK